VNTIPKLECSWVDLNVPIVMACIVSWALRIRKIEAIFVYLGCECYNDCRLAIKLNNFRFPSRVCTLKASFSNKFLIIDKRSRLDPSASLRTQSEVP
jgi:hypothetical protein